MVKILGWLRDRIATTFTLSQPLYNPTSYREDEIYRVVPLEPDNTYPKEWKNIGMGVITVTLVSSLILLVILSVRRR